MSTQSINNLSLERYSQEAHEILVYNFEQYFYSKNFRLTSGADIKEMTYYRHLQELLCNNNCQVYNDLYDKIAGKLKNCPKKKKSISHLIKQMREEQNISIDTKNYWEISLW